MLRRLWIWGLLVFLSGCDLQVNLPVANGPTIRPAVIVTDTPVMTATPTMPSTCAYAWSERELPDITDAVNQAFQDAGMMEVGVQAAAYGENCIDPETNQVARFLVMQTDFHMSVAIDETGDPQVMGNWVERILKVLQPFQPGDVPGPNPGYIGITFGSQHEKVNLWFPRKKAEDLIQQGSRGRALFDALRNP